jgi:hypothetical protein
MDPNIRWDQTTEGLDWNKSDTWLRARGSFQASKEWTGMSDSFFGKYERHTDTTGEQWLDPSKTTRTWPDPPLAQRAWSFDAHLGVHAGDTFDVSVGDYGKMEIRQLAATDGEDNVPRGDVTELSVNGTKTDVGNTPGVQAGVIIGAADESGGEKSSAFMVFGGNVYVAPGKETFGLRHEIVGSARHIYEPHFVSTPYPDGLTFIREGIETTRATYFRTTENFDETTHRMVYSNERAEKRDFGISQTQKVPTGGIGGNPFWLKDTKDWPDILRSLHFDFLPFMVPKVPTRPVSYRFWDTMHSTALFGGPTFPIVLDDYGIFDAEYYRMVIRHFTQSEQQITQWRGGLFADSPEEERLERIYDETALVPRNYINPHYWHTAKSAGKVPDTHPLKDVPASHFLGGSFSMEGWRGPCCELVLGLPPDIEPKTPRYDPSIMRELYPYCDSIEELTMNNKRKLHKHNCKRAHPFAVQDYYYSFVLAAKAPAANQPNQDVFDYSKTFEELRHIEPSMLSHAISGSAADIPFTIGARFNDLMSAGNNPLDGTVGECFDDAVSDDPMLAQLHDPMFAFAQEFVIDRMKDIQKWALTEIRAVVSKYGAKFAADGVWPMVQTAFPKLAPFMEKHIGSLAKAAIQVDFTKPVAEWGGELQEKLGEWGTDEAKEGLGWLKGDGKDMLKRCLKNKFANTPRVSGEAGDVELGEWGEGKFPTSEFADAESEVQALEPFKTIENYMNVPEEWVSEAADIENVVLPEVEAAAETSMAAVCGPMIVMVAVTLLLNLWEKTSEEETAKELAETKAASTWREWDTLRVPFDREYLYSLGPRANKLAGYGTSGDAVADSLKAIRSLYALGSPKGRVQDMLQDEAIDQLDIQEGLDVEKVGDTTTIDTWRVDVFLDEYRAKVEEFIKNNPGATDDQIAEFQRKIDILHWMSGATGGILRDWNHTHPYTGPKGQRYLNLDPTLKSVPCEGDLRTVANLIAMSHLCLKVVSPSFFTDSGAALEGATTIRARQLLSTAEIIRTMRVVDYNLRAASWREWGWDAGKRPDRKLWHPFPPMANVPTSLIAEFMTPIPVLVPTKGDMPPDWWRTMSSNGALKSADVFRAAESTDLPAGQWAAYISLVEDTHGACPTYEFNDAKYQVGGVDREVRQRAVPVPIFAPGRSPTMFVSSLDPTFAWPTLAVKGGRMSAFLDESAFFDTHKICYRPDPSSQEGMNLGKWRAAIQGSSCAPTFGGSTCRFILQVSSVYVTPNKDQFRIVNQSSSTVVLVMGIDGDFQAATAAPLKPGESALIKNVPMFLPRDYTAEFFVMPAELYVDRWSQWSASNPTSIGDSINDMERNLPLKFRSLKFAVFVPQFGNGDFSGTITVFDHTLTSESVHLFESRMRGQVVPIMEKSPHCYEPLHEFWKTDYRNLASLPLERHDAACKWLLDKITVQKNAAGIPVANPLDIKKQMNIYKIGRLVFGGERSEWDAIYNSDPTPEDFERGNFNRSLCKNLGTADHHPRSYAEGGLRVHHLLKWDDDAETAAKAASYEYDVEYKFILAMLGVLRGAMGALNSDAPPSLSRAVEVSVNDILNNNMDQYDAAARLKVQSPHANEALGAAEAVRIHRISAISKLTASIDTARAEAAIAEYKSKSPSPSPFTTALEMLFRVRDNPNFFEVPDTFFSTYPAFHMLVLQMAKDSYRGASERSNLLHPNTKQIAYYLTTGELASTAETCIYFMPELTETSPVISGPTLFVAFRGTDDDVVAKFTHQGGISLFQKIASFMGPYSDLVSNMHIALGTQANSPRFDTSERLVQTAATYNVNLILTGHSLGGSLAAHCLERNPSVTSAVVFNPGRGLDDAYFAQVEAGLRPTPGQKWYDRLVTYRVGGTSPWPLDDDPVSALSGGLGTTFELVGPGVPTRLKAHAIANWDTTAVKRDNGQPIYPRKPST